MDVSRMPKALLHNESGESETIDDLAAYYFFLAQVARRKLKELKEIDELDAEDISVVIKDMQGLLNEKGH